MKKIYIGLLTIAVLITPWFIIQAQRTPKTKKYATKAVHQFIKKQGSKRPIAMSATIKKHWLSLIEQDFYPVARRLRLQGNTTALAKWQEKIRHAQKSSTTLDELVRIHTELRQ